MRGLWAFLPDEFLVLAILGIGLALILGLITGRSARNAIGALILVLLLAPFVEAFIASLPWWILLPALVIVGLAILRLFASLFIGPRATDEMVGTLAADVVRFFFRSFFWLLALPFRLLLGGARRN